jgi:hypothetical protein
MSPIVESVVEDVALSWLSELGYTVLHGQEIAPGMPAAERAEVNSLQSRALAEIRDALLPKLLSGEIRVGEGPRAVVV